MRGKCNRYYKTYTRLPYYTQLQFSLHTAQLPSSIAMQSFMPSSSGTRQSTGHVKLQLRQFIAHLHMFLHLI